MPVIIQDGFSGTNGTDVSGRTPDTTNTPAGTWVTQTSSTDPKTGILDIQSNQCRFSANGDAASITAGSGNNDGYVEADWNAGGSDNRGGIGIRMDSTGYGSPYSAQNWYQLNYRPGAGTSGDVLIQKVVSTASTDLATYTNVGVDVNNTYTYKLVANGSSLEAFIDGTSLGAPVTDTSHTTTTRVGIIHYAFVNNSGRMDNFVFSTDLVPTQAIDATASNVAALTTATAGKGITAAASNVSALTKKVTKDIDAVTVNVATLTPVKAFFQTIAVTASNLAGLATKALRFRTLDSTSANVPTLTPVSTGPQFIQKAINAIASNIANLRTGKTFQQGIAAVTSNIVNMVRSVPDPYAISARASTYLPYPRFKAWDNNGNPLAGGKVWTYEEGTSNPAVTFTEVNRLTANTNPVILDANGEADIFFDRALKIVLTDANDIQLWTFDGVRIRYDAELVNYININSTLTGRTVQEAIDELSLKQDKAGIVNGYKNKLINGALNFWQRGTSFTTAGYTADRWSWTHDGNHSVTLSKQGMTTLEGDQKRNYMRVVCNGSSANSTSGWSQLIQRIESLQSVKPGVDYTLSFDIRAVTAGQFKLGVELTNVFGTGGSPSATTRTPVDTPIVVDSTNGWQRFTMPVTMLDTSGETLGTNEDDNVGIHLFFSAGTDYNSRLGGSVGIQTWTFDITNIQFEEGIGSEFEVRPEQTELSLCQRYYEKSLNIDVTPVDNAGAGWNQMNATFIGADQFRTHIPFKVNKRNNAYSTTLYNNFSGDATGVWALWNGAWIRDTATASSLHSEGFMCVTSTNATIAGAYGDNYLQAGDWAVDAEIY